MPTNMRYTFRKSSVVLKTQRHIARPPAVPFRHPSEPLLGTPEIWSAACESGQRIAAAMHFRGSDEDPQAQSRPTAPQPPSRRCHSDVVAEAATIGNDQMTQNPAQVSSRPGSTDCQICRQ
ncbi:hypothetical protein KCP73_13325 [Salmonella enterica subsp. enterica]|nr:hypothetical protein KCP73_13325 [Salmonella enterica subsp. enterica]